MDTDTTKINPQWLWSKANWTLFQTELDKHLRPTKHNIITQETTDNLLKQFYDAIETTMKAAVPKTKGKIIDNNNPWWTKELQFMRNTVNKLKKKMDSKPTQGNIAKY